MDIALKLFQQRQSRRWVHWIVTKVVSHIDVSEAPDIFFWEGNEFVDELATKARMEFPLEVLKQRESHVLQGTRIACRIDGRIVNNGLYAAVKAKISGT